MISSPITGKRGINRIKDLVNPFKKWKAKRTFSSRPLAAQAKKMLSEARSSYNNLSVNSNYPNMPRLGSSNSNMNLNE